MSSSPSPVPPLPADQDATLEALRGKRVLVVEDEPTWSGMVCDFYKNGGALVRTVSNAEDAITLLKTQSFDLLSIDLDLGWDAQNLQKPPQNVLHGDAVIRYILENNLPVRIAFASDSLSAKAKKELARALPSVTMFKKDAFADPEESVRTIRAQIEAKLAEPPTDYAEHDTKAYLIALEEVRAALMAITMPDRIATRMKAELFRIMREFEDSLKVNGDYKRLGLGLRHIYGDRESTTGDNLHALKNLLSGIMEKKRDDYPDNFIDAIRPITVEINQFLMQRQLGEVVGAYDIIRGVASNFNGLLERGVKRVLIDVNRAATLPFSAATLTRIVTNLTDNALRADKEEWPVMIRLDKKGLAVWNSGDFPAEWVDADGRLLVDKIETTSATGSGIGLKEVAKLAQKAGMHVVVERGTCTEIAKAGLWGEKRVPVTGRPGTVTIRLIHNQKQAISDADDTDGESEVFKPPEAMEARKIVGLNHRQGGDLDWIREPAYTNPHFSVEVINGVDDLIAYLGDHPEVLDGAFMCVMHLSQGAKMEVARLIDFFAENFPHVIIKFAFGTTARSFHRAARVLEAITLKEKDRSAYKQFILADSESDTYKGSRADEWRRILQRAAEMHMNLVAPSETAEVVETEEMEVARAEESGEAPAPEYFQPPETMQARKILVLDHSRNGDFEWMREAGRTSEKLEVEIMDRVRNPLVYAVENPKIMDGVFLCIMHLDNLYSAEELKAFAKHFPHTVLKFAYGQPHGNAHEILKNVAEPGILEKIGRGEDTLFILADEHADLFKAYAHDDYQSVLKRSVAMHIHLIERVPALDLPEFMEPPEVLGRRTEVAVIDHSNNGDFRWMDDDSQVGMINPHFLPNIHEGIPSPVRYLLDNPRILDGACLCILHLPKKDIQNIHDQNGTFLQELMARFPHVIFKLATGSKRPALYYDPDKDIEGQSALMERILEVQGHAFVKRFIFDSHKKHTPHSWEAVLAETVEKCLATMGDGGE